MSTTRKLVATLVVVVAIAGAFLGFTSRGHQMLYSLGFSTACGVSDNC